MNSKEKFTSESKGTATNESNYEGEATPNATEKLKQPPKMKTQPTRTSVGRGGPPKMTSNDQDMSAVHQPVSGLMCKQTRPLALRLCGCEAW